MLCRYKKCYAFFQHVSYVNQPLFSHIGNKCCIIESDSVVGDLSLKLLNCAITNSVQQNK